MKSLVVRGVVCLVLLTWVLVGYAQDSPTKGQPAAAPELPGRSSPGPITVDPAHSSLRLIQFGGQVEDFRAQPQIGVVGITFALYAEQEGGAPLWLETQNVELDEEGHYTALLGATQSEGLPLELFTSGEARWLGIRVQGQEEQARVLLVSVPYALRAAEAERLAGRDPSEFVLAEDLQSPAGREKFGIVPADGLDSSAQAVATKEAKVDEKVDGHGTPDFVAKFIAPLTVGDSAIFESGGSVGIGTVAPATTLDVAGSGNFQADLTSANLFTGNVNAGGVISGASVVAGNGTITGPFSVTGEGTFGNVISLGSVTGSSGQFIGDSTEPIFQITQQDSTGCLPFPDPAACPVPIVPVGLRVESTNTAGVSNTIEGISHTSGVFSSGVFGWSTAPTGPVSGVFGRSDSIAGVGGGFSNTNGGPIIAGLSGPTFIEVFRVENDGTVRAVDFTDLAGNPVFASLNTSNIFVGDVTAENLAANTDINAGGAVSAVSVNADAATFNGLVAVNGNTETADPSPNLFTVNHTGTGGAIAAFSSGTFSTIFGRNTATDIFARGVFGIIASSANFSTAVEGRANATSGNTIGVTGRVSSPQGTGGTFVNLGGGKIISGQTTGFSEVFSVDGTGRVSAPLLNINGGPDHFSAVISNPDPNGVALRTDGPLNISATSSQGLPMIFGEVDGQWIFTVDQTGHVGAPFLGITGGSDHFSAVISNPDPNGVALRTDGPVNISGTAGQGLPLLFGEVDGQWVFAVDENGTVALNGINFLNGQRPFAALDPNGTLDLNTSGAPLIAGFVNGVGVFSVDGGGNLFATSVTETSSRRWKKNIRPLSGALAKVEGLRGVVYELKATDETQIGVVAEEVGEVLPEVVSYEENGVDAKGVNYARLTALLIEAVKEQQEQIRELQAELAAVKAKLEANADSQQLAALGSRE